MIPPFQPHPTGAAWWPHHHLLVLADLHLEKGSAHAARGFFLPPYDTAHTLEKLESLLHELRPRHVLCLGDSFDDPAAWHRMHPHDRHRLHTLTTSTSWTWISGNHDPSPPHTMPGTRASEITIAGILFRHQPAPSSLPQVNAHFHPKATLRLRGQRISGPCFLASPTRLILPAFGAYTGGLDRDHPALRPLFPQPPRTWLIHRGRIYPIGPSTAPRSEARATSNGSVRRRRSKK